MRTLHRILMGATMGAALVVCLGVLQPWGPATAQDGHAAVQHGHATAAQHGHADDPQAHFEYLAERLELTAAQREALAGPFEEAFAAMQELHRLHDQVAAQLTEEQQHELGEMIHEMLGAAIEGGQASPSGNGTR